MNDRSFIDDLVFGIFYLSMIMFWGGTGVLVYVMFQEIFEELESWNNQILASILEFLLWAIIVLSILAAIIFALLYFNYRMEKMVYPRLSFEDYIKKYRIKIDSKK